MYLRDLARLLVKIAGLLILVSAVTRVPGDFVWVLGGKASLDIWAVALMVFAPAAISVGVGALLFFCVDPIIDRALFTGSQTGSAQPADLRSFEEIAFAVLGLYIFSTGLTEAVYYWGRTDLYYQAVKSLSASVPALSPPALSASDFGGFCAAALRLAIGIALMLAAHRFVALRRFLISLRPMSDAN